MKNKIKFRTQQRMTHTKNYAAHTQKMAAEWAGPEFKKSRVQEGPKTQKYGPKPRNHGSTAELGEKSHQNHTKNTLPMSQKHHQTKTPYFGRPASPDGHISAPNLIEVQSRNMSKKISPLRGEFFFCGAREGRHTVGK